MSWVTKVMTDSAPSLSVVPTLVTDPAALCGWVKTKKRSSAIASNPTIFLTFTTTTVLDWTETTAHDFYRTDRVQGIRRAGPYGAG